MKIYHWWPGRTWAGPCPIPKHFTDMAIARGSRYLTIAEESVHGGGFTLITTAFCCPKDNPSKKRGREIAVGRLHRLLEDTTWLWPK